MFTKHLTTTNWPIAPQYQTCPYTAVNCMGLGNFHLATLNIMRKNLLDLEQLIRIFINKEAKLLKFSQWCCIFMLPYLNTLISDQELESIQFPKSNCKDYVNKPNLNVKKHQGKLFSQKISILYTPSLIEIPLSLNLHSGSIVYTRGDI